MVTILDFIEAHERSRALEGSWRGNFFRRRWRGGGLPAKGLSRVESSEVPEGLVGGSLENRRMVLSWNRRGFSVSGTSRGRLFGGVLGQHTPLDLGLGGRGLRLGRSGHNGLELLGSKTGRG
jgi:hypothetical protein